MPKKPVIKKHLVAKNTHPRVMKIGRASLAGSVDANFKLMMDVFERLDKNPKNSETYLKTLKASRKIAIDSMEYMRDNMHPNKHDLRIIKTVIYRLENNFDHQGVVDAFRITCGLKNGKH